MEINISYLVNSGFAWFIVLFAIIGYFLTWARMKERWILWIVLATGWAFFAVANTLLFVGAQSGTPFLIAIWLSFFILVTISLALLFIKLTKSSTPVIMLKGTCEITTLDNLQILRKIN